MTSSVGTISAFSILERLACETPDLLGECSLAPSPCLPRDPQQVGVEPAGHRQSCLSLARFLPKHHAAGPSASLYRSVGSPLGACIGNGVTPLSGVKQAIRPNHRILVTRDNDDIGDLRLQLIQLVDNLNTVDLRQAE